MKNIVMCFVCLFATESEMMVLCIWVSMDLYKSRTAQRIYAQMRHQEVRIDLTLGLLYRPRACILCLFGCV